MPEHNDGGARAAYQEGVEKLQAGEPEEALRVLEPWAERESSFELTLAIGKCHLELAHGEAAAKIFEELLGAEDGLDVGFRAYLRLLRAAALALGNRDEEAICLLEEAGKVDARMEHAAWVLRRRIERGRAPTVRF